MYAQARTRPDASIKKLSFVFSPVLDSAESTATITEIESQRQPRNHRVAASIVAFGPETMTIRLSDIRSAGRYAVQTVDDRGEETTRLKRLGVCERRSVEVLQIGDPMIVRVVGSRIGISRRLASHVTLSDCETAALSGTAAGTA